MPPGPGQTGQSRYLQARLRYIGRAFLPECHRSPRHGGKLPECPSSPPLGTKADRKWQSRLNPKTARNGRTHRGSTDDHPIPARVPDGPYWGRVATARLNNLRRHRTLCCRSVPPVGPADDGWLRTGRPQSPRHIRGPTRCSADSAQIGPACVAPRDFHPRSTENQIHTRRRLPPESARDQSHRSRPVATGEWSQSGDLAVPAGRPHGWGQGSGRS